MRFTPLKTCALLTAALSIGAASTAGAQTLTRGVVDNDSWWGTGTSGQTLWLNRAVNTGAKIVQIEVDWPSVEPNKVSGNETSASNSGYNFAWLDSRVEAVVAKGLQPEFLIGHAPAWAEGTGCTSIEYSNAACKPNATAYGQMAEALAKRYSGSFPNPANPVKTLPRVRYFEAWGEPNLGNNLAPQWTNENGRWVNTSSTMYRNLLNAFYTGVKAGNSSDVVVLGAMAPYGDAAGGPYSYYGSDPRTHPVVFLSDLLCVSNTLKRICSNVTHFDVLAADPYQSPGNSPNAIAGASGDVGSSDLGKLVKVERAAVKLGTLAGGMKPLWVTEFGFDTNPPSVYQGVKPILAARWEEWSLQIFASEGVSVALTHLLRDEQPQTDPGNDQFLGYSGLYYYNGTAKPSLTAFEFPFVLSYAKSRTMAWGISPKNGTVTVQRQVGSGWRTVKTFAGHSGRIYNVSLGKQPHGVFRAIVGGLVSVTWPT